MDLSVLFLGTAGSVPTAQRALSGTLVRRGGERMLFDCGEGTQRQLVKSVGLIPVEEIFITHFHADHYLGLPGMLKTFDLQERSVPLTVYGPTGLKDLLKSLRRIFGRLHYQLDLVELGPGDSLKRPDYTITTFPTDHTTESIGYLMAESDRPGHFDTDRAKELGVAEGPDFGRLQSGDSIEVDGRQVLPADVLGHPRQGRKIVLTGDTAASEVTESAAYKADLLVHEATFGDEEAERAQATAHCTARQAAELAAAAEVKLLALTHLSTRYFGSEILDEARSVFKNTVVPRDFDTVEIPFPERGEPVLIRAGKS